MLFCEDGYVWMDEAGDGSVGVGDVCGEVSEEHAV